MFSVTPDAAFAWGAEGHRIIALIAADQLTPAAKAQIQQLLVTDDAAAGMVVVSTWADEIGRNQPTPHRGFRGHTDKQGTRGQE